MSNDVIKRSPIYRIYFCFNYMNFFPTADNELVFINFYAQWCRFSNLLAPIFDKAADKIRAEFPEPGRVVMAKVDCDQESMFKDFVLFFFKKGYDNLYNYK